LAEAVPAKFADLGRSAAGVDEQLDRGSDRRPGGGFQRGERLDQLVEDGGWQRPAGFLATGVLWDVGPADGEVVGQPGHGLPGTGQAEGAAFPQDHGQAAAGGGPAPGGDLAGGLEVV